jgi:hypothetical protein
MLVWSFGGGVQSVAIAVLVREGVLPVPDLAFIADTGRERKTTWEYLANIVQPYLAPTGLQIEIAPHSLSRVDLYDKSGLTLMPAYTAEGRLPGYCAGEWNRDAGYRWMRSKGVKQCDQWLGYSIDEQQRVKDQDHRKWCHLVYPLIEKRINRATCRALIEKAGLPPVSKSRCWMCPHQNKEEWAEVKADPEEWNAAVAVEKAINENDPEEGRKGNLFLYAGRVPLELADFQTEELPLLSLFRGCEGEGCWT